MTLDSDTDTTKVSQMENEVVTTAKTKEDWVRWRQANNDVATKFVLGILSNVFTEAAEEGYREVIKDGFLKGQWKGC